MPQPSHPAPRWLRPAWLLAGAWLALQSQELSVQAGAMRTGDFTQSSYAYEVDYRQEFHRNLAASVSYLNEGHVQGHHRDGSAIQVWGRAPFDHDRFAVGLGVGIYYLYDTRPGPAGGSENVHGTAPIYSASFTGYPADRWFYRAVINRVNPTGEMKVTTATMGFGYWFGRKEKPTPGSLGDAPDEQGQVSGNEVTLYGGQSIVNTWFSPRARAYAAEYRRGLTGHVDWTAYLLYEGDPDIIRRSGLAAQAWAVNSFHGDRFSVGIGLGPYLYIDRKHPVTRSGARAPDLAGLGSLTFSERITEHWIMRLRFDRVTSNNDRDADLFLLGLGYRWPPGGRAGAPPPSI